MKALISNRIWLASATLAVAASPLVQNRVSTFATAPAMQRVGIGGKSTIRLGEAPDLPGLVAAENSQREWSSEYFARLLKAPQPGLLD